MSKKPIPRHASRTIRSPCQSYLPPKFLLLFPCCWQWLLVAPTRKHGAVTFCAATGLWSTTVPLGSALLPTVVNRLIKMSGKNPKAGRNFSIASKKMGTKKNRRVSAVIAEGPSNVPPRIPVVERSVAECGWTLTTLSCLVHTAGLQEPAD